jgi:hypothetical protein
MGWGTVFGQSVAWVQHGLDMGDELPDISACGQLLSLLWMKFQGACKLSPATSLLHAWSSGKLLNAAASAALHSGLCYCAVTGCVLWGQASTHQGQQKPENMEYVWSAARHAHLHELLDVLVLFVCWHL